MLEKILEMLKVEALDEDQKSKVQTELSDLIDLKVNEKVQELLGEEKEKLVGEYEAKYEEYKDDITEKFSDFLDTILEEEFVIPEEVLEYARKGELYSDVIDVIKVRIGVDEGSLDEEARELLKEARDEITNLSEELNEKTEENLTLKSDARELAAEVYKRDKTKDLPLPKRDKVLGLLEGINSKDEIDRKFDLILEHKLEEKVINEEKCKKCGAEVDDGEGECPECGEKMDESGKGHDTVDLKEDVTKEKDQDPSMMRWKEILSQK